MSVRSMKVWSWLHTWTSLICTLFMLLLCLTGLPLIFHHEIGHLLGTEIEAPEMPDMQIQFVAFPGTSFSSPHHYGVFMHGNQALTAHLSQPVLIDASTSQVTDSRPLPWYFTALQLSRPLHFGDYGGKPLQIIWAVLDVITIILLSSGLYLWLAKRRRRKPYTASASISSPEAQQG